MGDSSSLKNTLARDLAANGLDRWKLLDFYRHDVVHMLRVLRRAEDASKATNLLSRFTLAVMKWRLRRMGRRLGIEIPLNVFGPGLAVVHPFGVVVSRKARIGENCRIHAGVNVGEHRGSAPSIGDDVYLGPGAKVVGGVKVGNRAVVGANAVVVKDVPAGVTVGGVPARIISNNDSASMIPGLREARIDGQSLGCGSNAV